MFNQFTDEDLERAIIAALFAGAQLPAGMTPDQFGTLEASQAIEKYQRLGDWVLVMGEDKELGRWLSQTFQTFNVKANMPDYFHRLKELHARRELQSLANGPELTLPQIQQRVEEITAKASPNLNPTPLTIPQDLPKREWLYGVHLARKYTSMTVAPAGAGKSTVAIMEALAVANNTPLLGQHIHEQAKVWYYNLEDPLDEMQRRIWAACLKHGLPTQQPNFFVDSGRDRPLIIVEKSTNFSYAYPDKTALIKAIKKKKIGLLIVDPFISSYEGDENNNKDVDRAIKAFNQVASECNCAIELIHHTGKSNTEAGNQNGGRGASAMIGAVRDLRTIVNMSEEEGQRYGIENHLEYIRLDGAKPSMSKKTKEPLWMHLEGLDLPNGDNVGVVILWTPPGLFEGIQWSEIQGCCELINKGRKDGKLYHLKANNRYKDAWVGNIIADYFGASDDVAESMTNEWYKNGVLIDEKYSYDYKTIVGLRAVPTKFSA